MIFSKTIKSIIQQRVTERQWANKNNKSIRLVKRRRVGMTKTMKTKWTVNNLKICLCQEIFKKSVKQKFITFQTNVLQQNIGIFNIFKK